uniref:SPRY domain-containing protein n=1 Tax=Meloidogyne javanica TaxID=6303 RepID=A0A915LLY4_MELJA
MEGKLSRLSSVNSLDCIESCTNMECLTFRGEMIKRLNAMEERINKNSDNYDSLSKNVIGLQNNIFTVSQQVGEITRSGKSDPTMEQLKKFMERNIPPQPVTVFVLSKNKLAKIADVMSCCDSKCLPAGSLCRNGNGIVKIRECGILAKYLSSTQNLEGNRPIMVVAESEFMRANIPSDVSGQTYVVFYAEMKVIPDTDENMDCKADLGLYKDANCFFRVSSDGHYYTATTKRMFSEPLTGCVVYGVGQIFPPRNKPNAPTQIFFTMNGKQIDKTILMTEDVDLLPHIIVKNCDAEVNFGMDDKKPFTYDIGKHEAAYDNQWN